MKNSVGKLPSNPGEITRELCSEKCIICLENRGCIYDPYYWGAIQHMVKSPSDGSTNIVTPQPENGHNLIKGLVAA